MNYLPVFLHLQDRPCLVVGGGAIATRKVEGLVKAGARVTVISPQIRATLLEWEKRRRLRYIRRCYQEGDLKGYFLTYAATGVAEVDRQMAKEARAEGALLNVVDRPTLCSFISPAIVQRGDLLIAISTGGKSPGFAKLVRKQLEDFLGPEYGEALKVVAAKREELKQSCREPEERQIRLIALAQSAMLGQSRQVR